MKEEDLDFIRDVGSIAKLTLWNTANGNILAQEIIAEIHKGRYGSKEGIWVQFNDLLERLEGRGLEK